MGKIGIWLNDSGVASILRYNNRLESMEREIMEQKLSEIKAQFLTTFGTEGSFEIKAIQTRPGKRYGRLVYRICANDRKTGAILKSNPGWLKQFS